VRAAIVQLRVDDAENAADRVTRVAGIVRAQTGVDLVVLPELWVPGAFAYSSFEASASTLPGPAVSAIAAAAREIGSYVLAGTFIEIDGDRLHNTAVLLDPQGAISRVYRKVHLFGFDHGEAATLTAGADVSTFALGDLATMAMTTCYDIRFPELYRLFLDGGAELIVVPAGWPTARLDHWLLLLRARAVENQLFVIGCNQVGSQEGVELGGHSLVVDPWGRTVAEAGPGEEILTVDIDLALVAKTRSDFPVLRDRRLGMPAPRL
jgi:predicted amidohydrolase